MQLSNEQILSFIECWKEDFGEVLTPDQARVEAMCLLDFFEQFAEGLTRIRESAKEMPSATPIT